MRSFSAVIERCTDTGLFVAHVPGFAGAHTQASSLDELQENLREVIALLLEDGDPPHAASTPANTTIACDHSSGDADGPQRRVQ